MAEARPLLQQLARHLGIEDGYRSALDGAVVPTSDATREALVAAMGFDASSEAGAAASLSALADEPAGKAGGETDVRCVDADEKLGARGVFGLWINLYSVRSGRNLGFGNLGDLGELVKHAARAGAAFVGVNPLHATRHGAGLFCPYAPVTRLFRDPLYLDPERIPELADCPEAQRRLASPAARGRADALRAAANLDPGASEALLGELLRPLHVRFRERTGPSGDGRRAACASYRAAQGEPLARFASFQALADHFESEGGSRDWHSWPAEYRDADGPAVRAFRAGREGEIDRHAWVQFELDRQLGDLARASQEAGLAIGLYTDLALGSAAGGFDTWSWPGLFARGATLGAPPDDFARAGQNWGVPPVDPRALRADGFRLWDRLLDAGFRHAGALRIDHALGLRRLFWIPEGASARDGAYVRYPEAELLAHLARASRRHGALVIAEDLGTVPPGFSQEIQARGMLSSRVLLFERDDEGFRPAGAYPRACLATANSHDLPPLAALASDRDLALRRRSGQIPDDAALEALRAARRRDRCALRARLVGDGWLDAGETAPEPGPEAWAEAVTGFLCATPAALVGISLDDLAGEEEPINLPGVAAEQHPSWTRRMRLPLESLFEQPLARRILDAVPSSRRLP